MLYDTDKMDDGVVRLICYRKANADEKRGYLPAYHFRITLCSGEEIGFCDLRVGQNINTFYGGNIGYSIAPEYRRKGYATRAVKLILELAGRHEMKYVLITTTPENLASRRVIEKAGGIFLDERDIPRDHEMYGQERRKCRRYKVNLSETN